jgi:hypothetical protein
MDVPLSIELRIASFQDAINDDSRTPSNILANFGPEDLMTYYDDAEAISYWDTAFPATATYTLLVTDKSDTEAVILCATKKDLDGNLVEVTTYTFRMHEEDNGNWLIPEIYDADDYTLIKKVNF